MNAVPETLVVGSVIYGADADVAAWVGERIPQMMGRVPHNTFAALGVIRDCEMAAGVVFHNYRPGVDIEISLAADNPSWAHPRTLRRLFAYPFYQLGVARLTCVIAADNARCRRFTEGLGWKLEGIHRKAFDGQQDAISYGMLPEDCRFLEKV